MFKKFLILCFVHFTIANILRDGISQINGIKHEKKQENFTVPGTNFIKKINNHKRGLKKEINNKKHQKEKLFICLWKFFLFIKQKERKSATERKKILQEQQAILFYSLNVEYRVTNTNCARGFHYTINYATVRLSFPLLHCFLLSVQYSPANSVALSI